MDSKRILWNAPEEEFLCKPTTTSIRNCINALQHSLRDSSLRTSAVVQLGSQAGALLHDAVEDELWPFTEEAVRGELSHEH